MVPLFPIDFNYAPLYVPRLVGNAFFHTYGLFPFNSFPHAADDPLFRRSGDFFSLKKIRFCPPPGFGLGPLLPPPTQSSPPEITVEAPFLS